VKETVSEKFTKASLEEHGKSVILFDSIT